MRLLDDFCIPGTRRRISPGRCTPAILELLAPATSRVLKDTQDHAWPVCADKGYPDLIGPTYLNRKRAIHFYCMLHMH
eukprot:scaffold62603_cov36-Tisochrysis_lutea.AAC.1